MCHKVITNKYAVEDDSHQHRAKLVNEEGKALCGRKIKHKHLGERICACSLFVYTLLLPQRVKKGRKSDEKFYYRKEMTSLYFKIRVLSRDKLCVFARELEDCVRRCVSEAPESMISSF